MGRGNREGSLKRRERSGKRREVDQGHRDRGNSKPLGTPVARQPGQQVEE